MWAVEQRRYGRPDDVIKIIDVAPPTPEKGQVRIRVEASSVNAADWMVLVGLPYVLRLAFGLRSPRNKIGGRDMAGVVDAIGSDVTAWSVGDEVFAELTAGAFAEFVVADEDKLADKPKSISFTDAATLPLAGTAAFQAVRTANIKPGDQVLVNGASGGVGTFAVQIARAFGAQVTGVCSTDAIELVASIGADDVIDYTTTNFTQGNERYDAIIDLIGNHSNAQFRQVLTEDGKLVVATGMPGGPKLGPLPHLLRAAVSSLVPGSPVKPFAAKISTTDSVELAKLVENGDVQPVIERVLPFNEIVEALNHQGLGHARGKTALTAREE